MKIKEKIKVVYSILDENSPKEIEFLKADTIWQLLFCIILSAQTTDKMVMKVAPVLFSKFPSIEAFKNVDVEEIKAIIKSIGFYNAKAKNLKETATILVDKYKGEVPLDIDELTTLPGVGRKTANCIIGHATEKNAVIVDTHFRRAMQRLGITKSSDPEKIEEEIKSLLLPEEQFRISMTANLFAREICHSQNPECDKCYLKDYCTFIFTKKK